MEVKARLFCWMIAMAGTALTPMMAPAAQAEDGYDLWLRYTRADQARAPVLAAHADRKSVV
jgi:alpha-glucuronidase